MIRPLTQEQLDDEKQLARTLGREINQQGLLHDDCFALEFGLYPKQGKRATWSFLGNALHDDAEAVRITVREVALYLMLLEKRSNVVQSGFSNTGALLEVILPLFQKAPLFIYDLQAPEYSFRHQSRMDFEEFRFTVPTLTSEVQSLWDGANKALHLEPAEEVDPLDSCDSRSVLKNPCDVFTTESFTTHDAVAFETLFTHIARPKERLESICEQIKNSFAHDSDLRESIQSEIEKTVTVPMAFSIRCLKLLSIAKQVVFYPARYELGHRSIGKDVIIAVYSRRLTLNELSSEFHKFDRVFQQIKQKRTAEEGEERARESTHATMAHEMGKVVNAISSSAPTWALSEVRYYFQMLVQNRSHIRRQIGHSLFSQTKIQELWNTVVSDYPKNFAIGKSLGEFVRNHAGIAKDIDHIVGLVFRGGLKKTAGKPEFGMSDYKLESSSDALCLNPDFCAPDAKHPPARLDVALPLAAALVCLFRNVEQNRARSSEVEISIDPEGLRLQVCNVGRRDGDKTWLREKGGSEEALQHYVGQYAPERVNEFIFPELPEVSGRWRTIIPLPAGFLAPPPNAGL